jgi:hypothetical protein
MSLPNGIRSHEAMGVDLPDGHTTDLRPLLTGAPG